MVSVSRGYPTSFGTGWKSGDERYPIGVVSSATATPSTSAAVVAWPFHSPSPLRLAYVHMGLGTAQAGAEARAGIYSDGADGRPNALIEDLGTLDLSATTGKRSWTATATVQGVFWVLVWLKNVATQATVVSPSASGASLLTPVHNTIIGAGGGTMRGLWLTSTYPGSMPAAAPAVDENTQANLVLVTVEAA